MRTQTNHQLQPVRFLSHVLTLLVLSTLCLASPARADEYDNLRLKWLELLNGGTNYNTADPEVAAKITSLNNSGNSQWTSMVKTGGLSRAYLWSDLTSTNNSSQVTSAYGRLLNMATAWATKGAALENNTNLVNDILGALDWMYAKRYHTNYPSNTPYDNWWDWEVGAPQNFNDVMVLVYPKLTPTQISQFVNAIDFYTPVPAYTAGNRTYTARVVAVRGIIGKSAAKLVATRDGLDPIFPYTWAEGFHRDGSFIQHGAFPYIGGYGDSEINDLSRIMYMLQGSTWAITNSLHTNFYNWVYEAYEPLIYKGACLDMVRGRGISRSGEDRSNGHSILHSINRMTLFAPANHTLAFKRMTKYWMQTDAYRNAVTTAGSLHSLLLAKAIRDDAGITPKSETVAHYNFPEMDRVLHLRPGWGAGLAMFSDRMFNYESINGENLKGWHTGDGMLYLYNGDLPQYSSGFWPTINPKRMPGTTVDTLALANGAYEGLNSTKSWVGGANILNTYGAAGMSYASVFSSLTARKSWFMFDDEIVAVGSGITSTDNRVIETTVENRKLNATGNNAFIVNGTAQSTTLGWSTTLTNVNWAHLTGNSNNSDIGYYFPSATTLKGLREARTNSWSDIGSGSTNKLNNRFLSLWRDHGSNPNNAGYAYVLLPNKTSAQVSNYFVSPNITVLAQTTNVHAARENTLNLLAANFWEDGSNTVDLVTSWQKSSVLVKEDPGTLEVAVSDPTQENCIVRRLHTSDDSYVWDGTSSNNNYGTATAMVLKSSGVGFNRQSYLKFPLASANMASATNVTLKLLVTDIPDGATTIGLYQLGNDAWQESTITWANRPAAGSLIASTTASVADQWISFDVTSYVNTQLAGDKIASFVLVASTSNKWVTIASQESTYGPELDLSGPASGFIDLELARSASSTLSADSRVTVTQLTPTIKLRVDVNCFPQNSDTNNGIRGHTWHAKFALDTTAPTVTVTAPSGGAYVKGSAVAVNATASDNVGVVGVQFKLDGANLLSEDQSSPYSITWNTTGVGDGAHALTAVARDAGGNVKTSAVVNVTVDNTAPNSSVVTAPTTGTRVSGTITVSGTAADAVGLAGVQFKYDSTNIGTEDTGSPYSVSWNTTTVADGAYTLTGVARDNASNTTISSGVSITVDNTGPVTTITSPGNGAVVGGSLVSLNVTATDGAGVAGVQFKVDGVNFGTEDTVFPYQVFWNTTGYSNGPHTITAVGRDTLNNLTTSSTITVTVDNTAPTVSVSNPLPGQAVNGFLTLVSANANDANGIAGVQFQANGVDLGAEDTGTPFQVAWNTLGSTNGIYQLRAIARDQAGNLATSAVVSVSVANTLFTANGGAGWVNTAVDSQQQTFTYEFDASPNLSSLDGVMGLSAGTTIGYSNLACIVRFGTNGLFDARNGGVYMATSSIPYSAGVNYHFRMVVNVPAHTYSAYVTAQGGAEQLIGANYAFRTEQAGVAILNNAAFTTVTSNAVLKAWNPLALDSALASWHRLDETFGLTAFDTTKNGYNGTVQGNAAWTSGGLNGALSMDGVDDAVQLPANQWNFTNGFTLSLWMYSDTAKSWESFVNFGNGNSVQNLMLYRDGTNDNIKFASYTGTNLSAILVSNVLVQSQWQQLAITLGPAGNVAFFTNGVLVKTGAIFSAQTVLRTNNFFGRASGGGPYHDGAMDDVRIYTRPLSTNEIWLLP